VVEGLGISMDEDKRRQDVSVCVSERKRDIDLQNMAKASLIINIILKLCFTAEAVQVPKLFAFHQNCTFDYLFPAIKTLPLDSCSKHRREFVWRHIS
jgi:hypothetical protein